MLKCKSLFKMTANSGFTAILLSCAAMCLTSCVETGKVSKSDKISESDRWVLWYDESAGQDWTSALAVGNGRLGGMVFGGVDNDRVQLNEDTLWSGQPNDPTNPDAYKYLEQIRKEILYGDRGKGQQLYQQHLRGTNYGMKYQTIGSLYLKFDGHDVFSGYRRQLNLDTAIAKTGYTVDGVTYTREYFASPVDQLIIIRLSASRKKSISFAASMDTPMNAMVTTIGTNVLSMDGVNSTHEAVEGGLKYQCRVRVINNGGSVEAVGGAIKVTGADDVILQVAAATSFVNYKDISGDPAERNDETFKAAANRSYEQMRYDHIKTHQKLFRRVSIDLGHSEYDNVTTDLRRDAFAEGKDPDFAALYFQFGRYLLISSSRPGTQPANLQGIWNDLMNPPWDCKYTTNINFEMNYWPAEMTNLSELTEPYIRLTKEAAVTGAETAKVHYGCRGWVLHHNTDIWRITTPVDGAQFGGWPAGAGWLTLQLWEHYQFTGDIEYLKDIYPVLKGASEFFTDYCIEHPEYGRLVTCPTVSPEHGYTDAKGSKAWMTAGPTIDNQIVRDVWKHTAKAAEILGTDKEYAEKISADAEKLPPMQIGKRGQLQEWLEDVDVENDHHRHVSHLYGLYPSDQITTDETPELAQAAKKSLIERGDIATGWSLGWKVNLWARLKDGDHVYELLKLLLHSQRTYPNMFDAHPPFQIDGNFGGTSGIAEMLLQSHRKMEDAKQTESAFVLELLAALPTKVWQTGYIKGLKARGGFEVDIEWKDGKLTKAVVKSLNGNRCCLQYGADMKKLHLKKNEVFVWQPEALP